jgi:NADH-quinone oxidoreductase subunit F
MRELIELAGGIRKGHQLKFWTPGGSSTPIFTDAHLDIPLDFDSVAAAGSMLGTRALQVFDETVSVVRAVARWTDFYAHESCGKCTPCREGTWWLRQIMERLEHGQGQPGDIEKLDDICDNILGRSFCALGDAATSPITSAIKHFRSRSSRPACTPRPPSCSRRRSRSFSRSRRPRRHDRPDQLRTRRRAGSAARCGHPDHRRRDGERAQGHPHHPRRRTGRHRDPAVL